MLHRAFRTALFFTLALAGCDGESGDPDAGADAGGEPDAGAMMSTMRPSKRSDVQGVVDPTTGLVVTFGGDDGPIVNQIPRPVFRDDTWVFEPGFGWTEVETTTAPSARARYGVAYDETNGRMLLFGGRFRTEGTTGPYTLYNDLWAFDFETRTWEQLYDGTGFGPGPRYSPALAWDDATGTLYVAGGGLNADALSPQPAADLWSFDGTTWTQIPTSGDAPSPRMFEGWAHDTSRGTLVAFAGQVGDFFTAAFRDMYALELETGVWTELDSGTGPIGRFNAHLVYDEARDRYVAFGGHTDSIIINDLWAFDPNGGGWSVLAAGDMPTGGTLGCLGNPQEIPASFVDQDVTAPQGRMGAVFTIHGDELVLFGGEGDCSDHLDDTWTWDLVDGGWTEYIESRSGESCARRGDDCECLCL